MIRFNTIFILFKVQRETEAIEMSIYYMHLHICTSISIYLYISQDIDTDVDAFFIKKKKNCLTQRLGLVTCIWIHKWGNQEGKLLLLLLLLGCFSRVQLCATPQTAAHQAPLSLGFSRQEHSSGLPFPSPVHESEKWKEVAQSCLTLSNPMDCSLPGPSIHGIFQARVLEWVAIAFFKMRLVMP